MKKLLTALCMLMLCVPSFSQEVEEIHVYDAISFVHALRSNRVVVVENNIDFENELENLAKYNPDEIKVYREYDKGDLKELVKMTNYPYLTMENDGMQLNLREVHNLTIRGPKGTKPLLRIQPRYAYVLRFTDSDNIRLENLVMGHTEGGYCEGGVVAFEDCRDVTIDHCDLYGCGMEGINFTRSMELKFTNSIIRDCTYQIMDINTSRDILLNLFFNPMVNAARAVAFQIYHAVSHFSGNFFTAVKPQIYKSYAAGEFESMQQLVLRSTVMSSLLTSILVFPILANTPYLLGVWLKEVPNYTVVFTQLVLINGLIDCTNGPTIAAALATGKIRRYQLIVGTLIMLNLPLSYTALLLGAEPQATMMISIMLSTVTALIRAWLLRSMLGFSFLRYLLMFARLVIASLLIAFIIYGTAYNRADNLLYFFVFSLLAALLVVVVYLAVAFSRSDVKAIMKLIKRKKQ